MLPVRHRMALHLAATPYKYEGRREADVRELLGYSAPRFWQVVNVLLDDREALEAEPQIVNRLCRLRTVRQRQRQARHSGFAV